jgi:SAM-dependent methyltransferase
LPGLPERSYDVVFCRLVLRHLQDPARAVAGRANLLVNGGRLVLVDMDLADTFTMPPSLFYESCLAEVVFPYGARIGVDYAVGVRLPELMSRAGLATESVMADQPIFRDAPEKHLWERTWAVAFRTVVASCRGRDGARCGGYGHDEDGGSAASSDPTRGT